MGVPTTRRLSLNQEFAWGIYVISYTLSQQNPTVVPKETSLCPQCWSMVWSSPSHKSEQWSVGRSDPSTHLQSWPEAVPFASWPPSSLEKFIYPHFWVDTENAGSWARKAMAIPVLQYKCWCWNTPMKGHFRKNKHLHCSPAIIWGFWNLKFLRFQTWWTIFGCSAGPWWNIHCH